MTQLARSSEARKIHIDSASMVVTPRFQQTGSIGADTIASELIDIETSLDIQSDAPVADIQKLVKTAERMCFLLDAIRKPHAVSSSVQLNGEALGE